MELVKVDCAPVRIDNLATNDVEQMYNLFEQYYDCVNYTTFCNDLYKKDKVIVARKYDSGDIKGFTTLKIMNIEYVENGRKKTATGIFSGDTIVSPEYWGSRIINSAFAQILLREKLKRPFAPIYWFLISKGYKTYLLLSKNFVEYYPNVSKPTPSHLQKVMDAYASKLYPSAYDPQSGLLRFDQSCGQLKTTVAPIDAHLLATQPSIAFFQEKNPNWQAGDELVCIGIVNWKLFAYYLLRSARFFITRVLKRGFTRAQRSQAS